jgi:Protein of unknown function (DUF3631)
MTRDPEETRRLIEAIESFFSRFVVFRSRHDALKISLFVLHTYAVEHADVSPYLHISSAEKMSGKSTLLELLEHLVARPWLVVSISEAVLFRKIEADGPTILLDEVDALLNGDKERAETIRGILNAGFERGRTVPRCVGPKHELREFNVFGPKVLAGLGGLPDTLSSRCIHVRLERKLPGDKVERRNRRVVRSDAEDLRTWLDSWSQHDAAELDGRLAVLPEGLGYRSEDLWEPLLAIAELAGPAMRERAVAAALDLSGAVDQTESTGVRLLAAVRDAFGGDDRISADSLVARLRAQADEGWGAWNNGNGITRADLQRRLKSYGISNQTILIGVDRMRGFKREQFDDAFARYLTPVTENVTPANPHGYTGVTKEQFSGDPGEDDGWDAWAAELDRIEADRREADRLVVVEPLEEES